MNTESNFLEGLRAVREAGLPARATDVAVIAAYRVFVRDCGADIFERLPPGPLYAKQLILEAYATGK